MSKVNLTVGGPLLFIISNLAFFHNFFQRSSSRFVPQLTTETFLTDIPNQGVDFLHRYIGWLNSIDTACGAMIEFFSSSRSFVVFVHTIFPVAAAVFAVVVNILTVTQIWSLFSLFVIFMELIQMETSVMNFNGTKFCGASAIIDKIMEYSKGFKYQLDWTRVMEDNSSFKILYMEGKMVRGPNVKLFTQVFIVSVIGEAHFHVVSTIFNER
jgi:hypothetical protein